MIGNRPDSSSRAGWRATIPPAGRPLEIIIDGDVVDRVNSGDVDICEVLERVRRMARGREWRVRLRGEI